MNDKHDGSGRFGRADGVPNKPAGPAPSWRWSIDQARSHALKLRRLYFEQPDLEGLSDDEVQSATIVNDVSLTALCRRARAFVAHHDPDWIARLDRGEFDRDERGALAPGAWTRNREREEATLLIMRLEHLGADDPEILITAMRAFWAKSDDVREKFIHAIEADASVTEEIES